MKRVLFEAVDTLFFRDGRPYDMDDPTMGHIGALFPPHGRTLIGALRAALARALGWNENQKEWSESVCKQLGSGNDLGPLQFRGPFLMRRDTMLFPVPAHIVGKMQDSSLKEQKGRWDLVALAPGTVLESDLGPGVRLPAADSVAMPEGAELLNSKGLWTTARGMSAILEGKKPNAEELVQQDELWCVEPRIGIQRDPSTRTVLEGLLYATSHVRLKKDVVLALDVDNLPDEDAVGMLQSRIHPVGGEARMCRLRLVSAPKAILPDDPDLQARHGQLHYMVVLLQPADTETPPQPGEGYADLPGTVVSACLPKPLIFGGWDSVARQPLPLRPFLASGSVLFMETDEGQLDQVMDLHGKSIGANTEWGFGQIGIGCWSQE